MADSDALTPPTLVLVHGAFENAAVWRDVVADLARAGLRAVAVDLPGRDGDPTPKGAITMDTHRDAVVRAVAAEAAPVVLVGHSFGGLVISAVAEAIPDRIRTLVYVAAYLPRSGDSLESLAATDTDSQLGPSFEVDSAAMVARVAYGARAALFLNDAADAARAGFADTMVDEPLLPPGTPVTLTADRFGRVPRAYVRTLRDLVVSPALQRRMLEATPCDPVLALDTGHAPFLTRPAALADVLARLASGLARGSDTVLAAGAAPRVPFPIEGATPDGVTATLLNLDVAKGPPAIVVHLAAGAYIPAHRHERTAEVHYVLEGDFINDGATYGPGAYFTHGPGVVHGPHASRGGCSILTVQPAMVDATDFHRVGPAYDEVGVPAVGTPAGAPAAAPV